MFIVFFLLFECGLTLTLLVSGILFVDHIKFTLAANNFAIRTALLDGCSYFHITGFTFLGRFIYNGK
jgi:hypothetical protein